MQDGTDPYTLSLSDLTPAQWLEEMQEIGDSCGFFEPLGPRHNAAFVEKGDTLLVSFETLPAIQALSADARPIGFDLSMAQDWSCLTVISNRDTWFREEEIFGFFDQMTDDGFFDDFEQVIFYGAGPCGYAACAFSVAAPGATVIALEPQATLDPRITEWDDRFAHMRRTDFTDRYGYAPDMIDAAKATYVVYDPSDRLGAMHAALFERSGVTRFRARHLGGGMQQNLTDMGVIDDLVAAAAGGTLDTGFFAKLYRARRTNPLYCKKLFATIEALERPRLAEAACAYIVKTFGAPRYRRKLKALRQARGADQQELSDDDANP